MTQLQYTGYHARSFWYLRFFGAPAEIHKKTMEDGSTVLGVMEHGPVSSPQLQRPHWTYATNGMSERRMPCREEPHGDPRFRTELVAYAADRAPWIVELLLEMARYPFVHQSGFAAHQTLPVVAPSTRLWDGYLLLMPPAESEEINPLAVDTGIGNDWVFYLQIVGLKQPELDFAIALGGKALAEKHLPLPGEDDAAREFLFLDRARRSLL